jgi:3-oxoacyl-[acyl-carrier-protein] synthase-3
MKESIFTLGVFITQTSSFLPNTPVSNDEIEAYLGKIHGKPSRARSLILRQNKIKTRYYSLDKNRQPTHSNAELAKNAIKKLFLGRKVDFDLLACGTSNADLINPSHASMVHGLINIKPVEIYSQSGICLSGIQALKVAYLSILAGESAIAVSCASELPSMGLLSKNFEMEYEYLSRAEENPYIAFEKDFLRFMLSDGAGVYIN